ncbi:hypothetical protein ADK86_24190 [Streptomyces sp. NRRL F-5755]|nr:hypothetical protein ADK86_24190 [Streptomyces sp. NRRL F-5755]
MPDGNVMVKVKTDRNTYYWGGAWYNASKRWSARWTANGTVARGDWTAEYAMFRKQGSRADSKGTNAGKAMQKCGTYNVTFTYEQDGPRWSNPDEPTGVWLKSGKRTYKIDVPCAE